MSWRSLGELNPKRHVFGSLGWDVRTGWPAPPLYLQCHLPAVGLLETLLFW